MPERTQTQGNSRRPARPTNNTGTKQTDRRTGAGVTRLSGTTQKVSLRDSKTGVRNKTESRPNVGRGNSAKKSSKETVQVTPSESHSDTNEEILAIEAVGQAQENENDPDGKDKFNEEKQNEAEQNGDGNDPEETPLLEQNSQVQLTEKSSNESDAPKKKEFDIREFASTVEGLSGKFAEDRFTRVGEDYPIEELISMIGDVNKTIDEYKHYTMTSQQQLELLRDRMQTVRDNIHESVQTRSFEVRQEPEQTLEQKELAAKLAQINAEVAHANIELARIVKMSVETETIAVEAAQSAAQAEEEAEQIRAETEWRERKEAERKAEEERKAALERKRKEEEKQREAAARRKQEDEWKRREAGHVETTPDWEEWPPHVFEISDQQISGNVGCIIRGNPNRFDEKRVTCTPINQLESSFIFDQFEELVSPILSLEPRNPDEELQDPIFVAIPFTATRSSMLSREPVVKAEVDGEWKELLTREVSFDDHKEYRFAQAEITQFTNVAVVTRFKRDYITLSRKTSKIVFTADHRVTMTTPRGSFGNKELLMIQVQPVDSNSLADLKKKDISMKGLLNSSPVVTTKWERSTFKNAVTVTVPCPPNPAKAKKLAALRAAKEAKMHQPLRHIPDPIDVQEKKERDKKKKGTEAEEEAPVRRTETRWYMGVYGGSDDDENDNLYLFQRYSSGRWTALPDVKIQQVKLDVLQFELEHPVEQFVILRTRTNVDEETALTMVSTLEAALSKKTVRLILRQRLDDPFDAVAQVVPNSRVDKALKTLQDGGYEEGPSISSEVSVCEGDIIEIGFRGNIRNRGDETVQMPFNSNMSTSVEFYLSEVDKYLQRNFSLFRGYVQFVRKYPIIKKPGPRVKAQQKAEDDELTPEPEPIQYHSELLAELLVNIPKYHIESNLAPYRAHFTIANSADAVNEDVVRHLAERLGEEWYKLAHYLNVRHSRVQSILRNTQAQDESEDMAKFDMIMTWLKRAPKASDKVDILSTALARSGRQDLAEDLRRSRDSKQVASACS